MNIAYLPAVNGWCGRITARRWQRALVLYGVLITSGLLLALLAGDTPVQIFGLGLMWPGGGFLAHADFTSAAGLSHLLFALTGTLAFVMAVGVWFATGNVMAPPFVWFLLAILGSAMDHGHRHLSAAWLALGLNLALAIGTSCVMLLLRWHGKRRREAGNIYLKEESAKVAARFAAPDEKRDALSGDDLKRLRFLLDRALQPLEQFNGFEWLDQFQTAAVRYQLHFAGYALAMVQSTRLPAFHAYLSDAQLRLILKHTQHSVWRYWALENAWGNLRCNPDPVVRDNIMFTGFVATQMALFQAATGRQDFNAPGSFSLRHPSGQMFAYDLPALIAKLKSEAARSDFHLIPCEPNWIYPLCNMIGAAAIRSQEPNYSAEHEALLHRMLDQEFLDYAGNFVPCRSNYTGLALPSIGGAMPQALPCFFLNATLPDVALRHWMLLRRDIVQAGRLQREKFWRIDTGNYGRSRAAAYSATALAAAELGDDEVKQLCLAALDEECPMHDADGHFYRPHVSVWAHAVEFMARCTLPGSFRRLINAPTSPILEPHISLASYPGVLAASAHAAAGSLSARLYPGSGVAMPSISLAGLRPKQRYHCTGAAVADITADAAGQAILPLQLAGMTDIFVQPME